MPPGVTIMPSTERMSVLALTTSPGVTSITSGFPALPTPTIFPSLIPMSPLTIPSSGSMTMAFVITKSSAPSSAVTPGAWPMPSRRVLPPPNTASSPYVLKSRSIWMTSPVSARWTRSPVVGP